MSGAFRAEPELYTLLHADPLRVLSARRHLLMHRAGIVDQKYLDESGETIATGSSLAVTPFDVSSGIKSAVEAATAMARAAEARC